MLPVPSASSIDCHPRGDLFPRRHLHVPGKTEILQESDESVREVDPIPGKAEGGRCWEGVVVVVPTLAPEQNPKDFAITAVVAEVERLRAEGMEDGVESRN